MYTIDKLQKLSDFQDNLTNESILAKYLLMNLTKINTITLKQCIKDTNISKSSIHRFFSSAGFDSFRELIDTLQKEMEDDYTLEPNVVEENVLTLENIYDEEQLKEISSIIKKANKIYFYGKQSEIEKFRFLIKYIIGSGKRYSFLNIWNLNKSIEKIKSLKSNDLLIVVDTLLRIQDLYDYAVNNRYLIPIDEIYELDFNKVFIGDSTRKTFGKFTNIKVNHKDVIGLEKLDFYLYEELVKGGK